MLSFDLLDSNCCLGLRVLYQMAFVKYAIIEVKSSKSVYFITTDFIGRDDNVCIR